LIILLFVIKITILLIIIFFLCYVQSIVITSLLFEASGEGKEYSEFIKREHKQMWEEKKETFKKKGGSSHV